MNCKKYSCTHNLSRNTMKGLCGICTKPLTRWEKVTMALLGCRKVEW